MVKQIPQFPTDFLPKSVTEESLYERERKNNNRLFKEMLKKIKPDLYVLFDLLEETNLNPLVVWQIIRQLNNISLGGGWGDVTVKIQNRIVTFIYGIENVRIEEKLILDKKEE